MAKTQAPPANQAAAPGIGSDRSARSRLTVVHVVVLELGALAVLAGRQADGAAAGRWTIGTGLAALVAVGVVFLRARGGWWYAERGPRRRWQRRRAARTETPVPGLGVLGPVAPGLTIRSVEDRGTRLGVGQDPEGWYAALALDPGTGPGGHLALDRLLRLLPDATAISVVSQLTVAPSPEVDPRAPAVQSYLELLGTAPIPADQSRWVAVRLGPRDAADAAAARGGGLDGVERAIAALVGRAGKLLSGANLRATPLDPDGLAGALAAACGLTGRPGEAEEQWTSWYAGGLAHCCLLVTRWPRPSSTELFARLARLPANLVSVAVTGHGAGVQGVIRVAGDPKTLARAVEEARTLARRYGAQVRRLDGDHALGVYASAPTAAVIP
jgi:type VII secretion protein EccE